MKKLVTILIPTLKERNLDNTLNSIKNQIYRDYETIIIYDEYKKGISWGINCGVKKCNTKYFFVCADDIELIPNCIDKMVFILENNTDYSFTYSDFYWNDNEFISGIWDYERLKKGNYISGVSLIKTSSFLKYNESLKRLVDWDYWLRASKKGQKGYWINDFLYKHNDDMKGISSKDDYEDCKKEIYKLHNLS